MATGIRNNLCWTTMRPPEIIIDIMNKEIRGHTSLSTALIVIQFFVVATFNVTPFGL